MKAKKIFQELQQKYPELTAEEFIELGDLYFEGKVVKPDLIKSYQMYSKAAELGCDEAKIKLIARIGRYDEVNILTKRADLEDLLHYEKMAKQYLEEMAEKDFGPALLEMGRNLTTDSSGGKGNLIYEDFKKGKKYLIRAYQKGYDDAFFILGMACLNFQEHYDEAFKYLKTVAHKGHHEAIEFLADFYNPQTEYGFNDPTEYDKWLELKNKL